MKVDVTFVNFPASDRIKDAVAERIESRIQKYTHKITSARAVFSVDGFRHQVKLHISGDISVTVSASSSDVSRSVEQAMDKLSSALRRVAAQRKKRWTEGSILQEKYALKNATSRGRDKSIDDEFESFDDDFSYERVHGLAG